MATTQTPLKQASASSPKLANAPLKPQDEAATAEIAAEQALVPSPHPPAEEGGVELTAPLARLPVELDVALPVRDFRVRNLLALATGQVIETQWVQSKDVPLAAGQVQLACCEFEVIDTELAVRVTRLA
jgi:flagellar motor switch protein FliM